MSIKGETVCTGRCYCGARTFTTTQAPQTVAYCHCDDCRRATGGPVAAFAAFEEQAVTFTPDEGRKAAVNPGVTRTFCADCGSSLTGRYDYLPGQVYISLGVVDQADDFAPRIHTHESERLTWLHIDDDLERVATSGRATIADPSKQ
ncbi:GFA family protein [Pelagibius sp. Alg239-R121]|uniref:GFA family protein n=1 Tax=Pelagibius sp. Alg239-R121 TaxID=2993448 RepID=UPI0024A65580|nr:GFA family protein [Pelagibius sp. Alg239-R121]